MKKIALGCLAVLLFAVIVVGGVGYYFYNFVTKSHQFADIISVPLPPEIGGTLNLDLYSVGKFDLDTQSGYVETNFKLTPAYLNAALPTTEFSVLVDATDNPNITSMLGRLNFVANTAVATVAGPDLVVGAQLAGELYVRESRTYQTDEEQPGSDEALAMGVDLIISASNVSLNPQWTAAQTMLVAELRLDNHTRTAWLGRYGNSEEFANMVEAILNQRLAAILARLDLGSTDLRGPLYLIMERADAKIREDIPEFGLNGFTIDKVEIDNCLSQSTDGSLQLGLAVTAKVSEEMNEYLLTGKAISKDLPTLPELTIRPSPC